MSWRGQEGLNPVSSSSSYCAGEDYSSIGSDNSMESGINWNTEVINFRCDFFILIISFMFMLFGSFLDYHG